MQSRLRIPAILWSPPGRDRRRDRRTKLVASNDASGIDLVVITEISAGGARLITPVPMQVGHDVRLKLPLLQSVRARIVWVSSRIAGCEFLEPIHPALLRVLIAAVTADRKAWRGSMPEAPFPPG